MKKIKIMSFVLALTMSISALSGCGKAKKEAPKPQASQKPATATESGLPKNRKAEKIGTIGVDYITVNGDSGIYYQKDGKYGVMTLDGKHDTGAKYTYCKASGDYFQVSTANFDEFSIVKDMNCMGLIDAKGNEIIPMEYAVITKINDHFYKLITVTHETDDKDYALVYSTDDAISFAASDDDVLYKGSWKVFDVKKGKMVSGAHATKNYRVSAQGGVLTYTEDRGTYKVNGDGESIPDRVTIMNNGYYSEKNDKKVYIYNWDRDKVATYTLSDFIPYMESNGYFFANKSAGEIKYVVMDKDFNIVSAEFETGPILCGKLLVVDGKLHDFDGNVITDVESYSITADEQYGEAYFLKCDENNIIVAKDGTELYKGSSTEEIYMEATFNLRKKIDDKNMYYSFKDKDFTLEGYGIAPFLVRVNGKDDTYNLVDTITGKTVLEGYKAYSSASVPGSEVYIYAKKADGGMDVYRIK